MKPRQFTKYKKLGSPSASPGSPDRMLTSYPAEALVEKDKKYTEQKILIPEFSVPGILAKPEVGRPDVPFYGIHAWYVSFFNVHNLKNSF